MSKSLENKLEDGNRLDFNDGVNLYNKDIFTLGKYANKIRRNKFKDKTFFNINRHINPTNVCKDVCKFCAYSASRKNKNQYTMTYEQILEAADKAVLDGATEVHIVSAHNNKVSLDWYMDIFKTIRQKYPNIHIKALTAAEVNFLSTQHNKSYEQILELMEINGVNSMPGGGAEIFDKKIRDFICKGKVSSEEWLKIHSLWQSRGNKSNATMLFGHIETREHRIDHMLRLRNLQDKSNGFNVFIPLVYQKYNNFLKVDKTLTGQEILKTIAISRLMLDNINHIKAYWATLGFNLALVAQEFGANDIDGTIQKESIQSAAGANSSSGRSIKEIVDSIKNSGFTPIERDSLYNELKTW